MIFTGENKCKLCLEADLENVGSHVFTDAIIRSAVYIEGKLKRGDYEAVGSLSYKELGFSYFGASVLPEVREAILGHKQTDEEIEATSDNPFINREIVCRSCERSFVPIEQEFVKRIYNRILDSDNFSEEGVFESSEEDYLLMYVFLLINIWRASTAKYNDWCLDPGYEELMRSYLYPVLQQPTTKDMLNKARESMDIISCFQFAVFALDQTEGLPSENAILIDYTSEPYMFLLNRLMIVFSSNCFDTIGPPASISDYVSAGDLMMLSSSHDALKVKLISQQNRLSILRHFYMGRWDDLVQHTKNILSYAYNRFTGSQLPLELYEELDRRIAEFIKQGGQASPEALINLSALILQDALKDYFE